MKGYARSGLFAGRQHDHMTAVIDGRQPFEYGQAMSQRKNDNIKSLAAPI